MFKDRKLLVTGGTGSIGESICNYFNKNGCKEIYSTTTNLNKVKSDQDYIKFKEFHLLKHFTKKMVKKRFGRIVFISSVVAHTGNTGQVNYTASKAAISGMVKSLALELSTRNITVNSVAPGFIQSNMTDKLNDIQKKAILDRIPMKKLGVSSDIARAVGFLCSENADYITGQTLHVNGGLALIIWILKIMWYELFKIITKRFTKWAILKKE